MSFLTSRRHQACLTLRPAIYDSMGTSCASERMILSSVLGALPAGSRLAPMDPVHRRHLDRIDTRLRPLLGPEAWGPHL